MADQSKDQEMARIKHIEKPFGKFSAMGRSFSVIKKEYDSSGDRECGTGEKAVDYGLR